MTSSRSVKTCPRSVRMPRRCRPSSTTNTTPSTPSCGVEMVSTTTLPNRSVSPAEKWRRSLDLSQGVSACRPVGLGGDVDRQTELAMQDAHAAGVVHMVVGNQDGIDTSHVPTMQGKPLLDLASADSGIEQQLDAACLDVDAVAVAAGLEGDDCIGRIVPQGRLGRECGCIW